MAKKINTVAAILAAGALLLGGMFVSCSDDGDDNNDTPETTTTEGVTTPTQETPGGEEANSKKYDFTALTAADLTKLGVTAKASDTVKATTKTSVDLSIGATVSNEKEKLRVRFDENSAVSGLNVNGATFTTSGYTLPDVGEAAGTGNKLACTVEIPVSVTTSKVKIVANVKATGDISGFYVGLMDSDGKVLAKKECPAKSEYAVTYEGTKPSTSKVLVVASRPGSSGGFDILNVTVTPVE